MRGRRLLAGILLLSAALAGCAGTQTTDQAPSSGGSSETRSGTSYSYSAGGSQAAEDDRGSFQAPSGAADLSVSAGGQGRLTVTVEDASGTVVFQETFTGSGGQSENTRLDGAAGRWTVRVEVQAWDGGFSLNVQGR